MLKQLSIASAGAALVTLGVGAVAPAQAASLTKVSSTGTIGVNVTVPPFSFSESVLIDVSVDVDDLENRVIDGDLTLEQPFSYLLNYLNTKIFPATASITSFLGSGTVSNSGGFLSSFNFFYDQSADILTVNNYDVSAVSNCLVGTCFLLGQGSFAGNVTFPPLPFVPSVPVPFGAGFNFDITQTATPIGEPGTNPQPVPEPAAIAGLAGIGAWLATRRREKQVKQAA